MMSQCGIVSLPPPVKYVNQNVLLNENESYLVFLAKQIL